MCLPSALSSIHTLYLQLLSINTVLWDERSRNVQPYALHVATCEPQLPEKWKKNTLIHVISIKTEPISDTKCYKLKHNKIQYYIYSDMTTGQTLKNQGKYGHTIHIWYMIRHVHRIKWPFSKWPLFRPHTSISQWFQLKSQFNLNLGLTPWGTFSILLMLSWCNQKNVCCKPLILNQVSTPKTNLSLSWHNTFKRDPFTFTRVTVWRFWKCFFCPLLVPNFWKVQVLTP